MGGDILDAVLGQMNRFGRVVVCGLIASYNATGPVAGPARYAAILMKRLRVQGFIIFDYIPRYAEAIRALTTLYHNGQLKWRLHEVDGLENADQAVRLLYQGRNQGKLLVKVAS